MVTFADKHVFKACLKFAGSNISLADYDDLPFNYTQRLLQKDMEKYNATAVFNPLKLVTLHLHCKAEGVLQSNVDAGSLINRMTKIHDDVAPLVREFRFFQAAGQPVLSNRHNFFGDNDSDVRFVTNNILKNLGSSLHLSIDDVPPDIRNYFGTPRTTRRHDRNGRQLNARQQGYRADMETIFYNVFCHLLNFAPRMGTEVLSAENTIHVRKPITEANLWLKVAQPYLDFLEYARQLPPLNDESLRETVFQRGSLRYMQAGSCSHSVTTLEAGEN